jgi:hypothetical protein
MPEESKPAAKAEEKKAPELDRKVRHLGAFKTFRGVSHPAYLQFQDVEGAGRGFAVIDAKTGREFKPGVRVMSLEHLAPAKLKFTPNGKTEAIPAPAAAK